MHRTSRLYVTERARPRTSGVSTAGVGILHVAEWSVGMVYLTKSQRDSIILWSILPKRLATMFMALPKL